MFFGYRWDCREAPPIFVIRLPGSSPSYTPSWTVLREAVGESCQTAERWLEGTRACVSPRQCNCQKLPETRHALLAPAAPHTARRRPSLIPAPIAPSAGTALEISSRAAEPYP